MERFYKTCGESSSSPRTEEWSGFTRRAEKVVLRRRLRSGAVLQDGLESSSSPRTGAVLQDGLESSSSPRTGAVLQDGRRK